MSPVSEFLKDHDIQEVYENELTIEFTHDNVSCQSNCDGVADADYVHGMQEGLPNSSSLFLSNDSL